MPPRLATPIASKFANRVIAADPPASRRSRRGDHSRMRADNCTLVRSTDPATRSERSEPHGKKAGQRLALATPPPALLKVMNVVMRPLLSSRLGTRITGVMLLDFAGRRSGRRFRVPVNFHLVDGVPMAFTLAAWRYNFAGGAPVTLTHRGRVQKTRGTLVSVTPDEMGQVVRKSLDTGGSAQRMGIRTVRGHEPTAAELAALGPALGTSVIRLDFEP